VVRDRALQIDINLFAYLLTVCLNSFGNRTSQFKRSLKTFMFGQLGRGALCLNAKGAD